MVVVERKSDVVGKETVLVSSVRAICQEIKNVVKFYVLSTNGNKLTMNFKVIVSIFGKHFSQFEYFS